VEEGLPEKLRAITGVPFSTLIRHIATIYLQREAARLQQSQSRDVLSTAHAELSEIISDTDISEIPIDE